MPAVWTALDVSVDGSASSDDGSVLDVGSSFTVTPSTTRPGEVWVLVLCGVGDVTERPEWPEPAGWTSHVIDGWWVGTSLNYTPVTFTGFDTEFGLAWYSGTVAGADLSGPSYGPGHGIAAITRATQTSDDTPPVLDPTNPTFGTHDASRLVVQIAGGGLERDGGDLITPSSWTTHGTSFLGIANEIEAWLAYTTGTAPVASTIPARASTESPGPGYPTMFTDAIALEFTDVSSVVNGWECSIDAPANIGALPAGEPWEVMVTVDADEAGDILPGYLIVEVVWPVALSGLVYWQQRATPVGGSPDAWGSGSGSVPYNLTTLNFELKVYLDDINWEETESVDILISGTANADASGIFDVTVGLVEP